MTAITLVGLRVLREVAACGSFSGAGAALGFTQSAISRQVADLERAAGATLFERTNRGAHLTEDGKVLLRHAAAALDQLERAAVELADRHGSTPRSLRVGAFSSAMVSLVPTALRRLRDVAPTLRLSLTEGTSAVQLQRIRSRRTDLAVVSRDPGDAASADDLVLEPLLDDPLLVAVAPSHRLATRREVEPDELADEAWVIGSQHRSEALLGAWPHAAWTPRVAFTARDWNAKIGLVAAGLGVTVVPGLSAASVAGRVRLVPIRHQLARREILVARPAAATTGHPAQLLADILREQAGG